MQRKSTFEFEMRDHSDPDLATHTDWLDQVNDDIDKMKTVAAYAAREN